MYICTYMYYIHTVSKCYLANLHGYKWHRYDISMLHIQDWKQCEFLVELCINVLPTSINKHMHMLTAKIDKGGCTKP